MSWRETFILHFGPGAFSGITFAVWLRVLRDNRFSVDGPYWGRAAMTTLGSVANSAISAVENLRFGRRVAQTPIPPPLFVLGIWRSGTTHLHNLLAQDERFAFPNFYQTLYPHTFLSTEATSASVVGRFLPRTRPQDNMGFGIDQPQEDEFALCSLIGRSLLMSLAFPRGQRLYDRYLTLRGLSDAELAEWKAALTTFVRKLTFKYRRPLVLKSPGHTCRIRVLLEMFPGAKFVHIRRNPFDVFQSTRHTVLRLSPLWAMQRPDHRDLDDTILRQYREVYESYFEERDLIPAGRLHEVRFEDVEADPNRQMRGIYEALDLPDFGHVEPALRRYVDSLGGYRKNAFPELPSDLRRRIAGEWCRCFREWGYSG
jgi:hypothetical protein